MFSIQYGFPVLPIPEIEGAQFEFSEREEEEE